MQILKLKMAAFGAFLDETEIDFSKLNEKGIFLLTGPTGVGKTTIFDAISYGLFGEISGSGNCLERVVSDFKEDKDTSFVELTLEIAGVTYFIRREPKQKVIGRGSRVIERLNQAVLSYQGKTISKVSEVNSFIVEKIGMNAQQFRQIVMIPQGEFVRLLTASSEDKVSIFRRIFQTEDLKVFEESLAQKAKELREEIQLVEQKIKSQIQLIDKDNTLPISEAIPFLKNALMEKENTLMKMGIEVDKRIKEIEDKKESMRKQDKLNNDILLVEELNRELHAHKLGKEENQKKEEILSHFPEATKFLGYENQMKKDNILYESDKKELNEFEIKLKQMNEEIEVIKDKLQFLDKEKDSMDLLQKENVLMNQKLQDYDRLIGKKKRLAAIDEMLNKLSLEEKEKNYLDMEEKLKTIKKNSNELENLYLKYPETLELLKESEDKMRLLKLNDELRQNDLLIRSKIEKKKIEIEKGMISYLKAKEKSAHYERIYLENEACHLSSFLVDNEPCLVCGSKLHPFPAKNINETINKEQLEEAKESEKKESIHQAELNQSLIHLSQELEENCSKVNTSSTFSNVSSLMEEQKNKIESLSMKRKELGEIQQKISELHISLTEGEEKQKKLKAAFQEAKDNQGILEKEKEGIKGELKTISGMDAISLRKEINKNQNSIEGYQKQVKENQTLFDEKQQKMNQYQTRIQVLNNEMNRVNASIMEHQSLLKKATFDYHPFIDMDELTLRSEVFQYNKKELELISQIEMLKKELKDLKIVDLTPLLIEIKELEMIWNGNRDKYYNEKSALTNSFELINQIEKDYKESSIKIKRYEEINSLSDVANGKNKEKMSFEKYVLSVYFDEILENANLIFKKLSMGRYQMIRSLSVGRAQGGLDIDVYDYNSDKVRDCKTLSGGESFKAALSLALGLSEVISQKSGGISVEQLFIDEGFGSLDQESLDQAINVLQAMKENGRTIGIISHVEELKNRIDQKIILGLSSKGSRVLRIIS